MTGQINFDQLTLTMTGEANGIMDEVRDIVALAHLDDSKVNEGVKSAQTKREKTITDLHEFDSTQTTAAGGGVQAASTILSRKKLI